MGSGGCIPTAFVSHLGHGNNEDETSEMLLREAHQEDLDPEQVFLFERLPDEEEPGEEQDEEGAMILPCIMAGVVAWLAFWAGSIKGRREIEDEAVLRAHARWHMDENGKTELRWKNGSGL